MVLMVLMIRDIVNCFKKIMITIIMTINNILSSSRQFMTTGKISMIV